MTLLLAILTYYRIRSKFKIRIAYYLIALNVISGIAFIMLFGMSFLYDKWQIPKSETAYVILDYIALWLEVFSYQADFHLAYCYLCTAL